MNNSQVQKVLSGINNKLNLLSDKMENIEKLLSGKQDKIDRQKFLENIDCETININNSINGFKIDNFKNGHGDEFYTPRIVTCKDDSVTEIGTYLDFHTISSDKQDYKLDETVRFTADDHDDYHWTDGNVIKIGYKNTVTKQTFYSDGSARLEKIKFTPTETGLKISVDGINNTFEMNFQNKTATYNN